MVPVSASKQFHRILVDADVSARLRTLSGKGHLLTFISPEFVESMLTFFSDQLLRTAP
jgi:hypothetical protein